MDCPPPPSSAPAASAALRDLRGRPLRDLRISVTDRCNFRCGYCMPRSEFGPGFAFLKPHEVLRFEQLKRLVGIFQDLGVTKLRITGGEPLLRRQLPELISMLPKPVGTDVAMTTNGSLLARHAKDLAAAGLQRVTVSLDSLDEELFRRMSDVEVGVTSVLRGIEAAQTAGLGVKVNAVIRKGVNDAGLMDLVRRFRGTGITLRLIEFMDVGNSNRWAMDQVLSASEMLQTIGAQFPLHPLEPTYSGEVARRYAYCDGGGELGIIASVTQPFCGDCSRARLSAQGKLYTCLFATDGIDLRHALNEGQSDTEIANLIGSAWRGRSDAYSESRGMVQLRRRNAPKIEMSYIGG